MDRLVTHGSNTEVWPTCFHPGDECTIRHKWLQSPGNTVLYLYNSLTCPDPLWGVISPEIENESGLGRKDTTKIHNHAQSLLKVNPPDKQIHEVRTAADLKEGCCFLKSLYDCLWLLFFSPHQGESVLLCNIERISGVLSRLPADLPAYSSHLRDGAFLKWWENAAGKHQCEHPTLLLDTMTPVRVSH